MQIRSRDLEWPFRANKTYQRNGTRVNQRKLPTMSIDERRNNWALLNNLLKV